MRWSAGSPSSCTLETAGTCAKSTLSTPDLLLYAVPAIPEIAVTWSRIWEGLAKA